MSIIDHKAFTLHMVIIKPAAIITHLAGWLTFISLPLLFLYRQLGNENIFSSILLPNLLLFYSCYIFIFYFNACLLIPQLYFQKKIAIYFMVVFLLLLIVCFLKPFEELIIRWGLPIRRFGVVPPPGSMPPQGMSSDIPPIPERRLPPLSRGRFGNIDIVSIFLFVMTMALGMALRISQQLRIAENRAAKAEAGKTTAELSFLKAQINPHFLFNTLNNIYTLAITKSENTAESIMKLSNIMRYVTDEINEDFVSLQSEVDCIRDFIDLQRLRLGKNVQLEFTVYGQLEQRKIAPLILMPFVENVFKYGISNHEPSAISIQLYSESRTISLFCQNRLFDLNPRVERNGIGIDNTKQRLQYLYPDKHFLDIITKNEKYTVHLILQV